MFNLSLKTRMTLLAPVVTCLVVALLLSATHHYVQNIVKETVSTQQFLITSILADEIDQKLQSAHGVLMALAREIPPDIIDDPPQAFRFLNHENKFTSIFSNGVFLFDRQGRMVAELPLGISRSGTDFSYREYITATFARKAPHISDPYISSQNHHHPAIMFTAPVFDASGEIIAVLGGSVDLATANFLGKLASVKIGKTGYVYLFSTNRLLISHPDTSRIMKQDFPPGANRLLDRALQGFEGTDETVTSRGLKSLTSFKRLTSKNWIVGANYPIAEAYAPIIRLQLFFAASIIPVLLLLFCVMRRLLKRITDPLIDFTRHVELLPEKTGQERIYPNREVGEVATLGSAFNNLIAQLDRQREESENRELLYRTLFDSVGDAIFIITMQGVIVEVNEAAVQRLGYPRQQLIGMAINDIQSTECVSSMLGRLQTIRQQGFVCFECILIGHDGAVIPVEANTQTTEFNGKPALLAVARDISGRKQAEELLLRQNEYLRALHDTTLGLIGRLELQNLLSAIIARAATLMNTEHGYIYLLNPSGTEMNIQVQLGVFDTFEHHPLKRGEGLAGHIWALGDSFQVDDYSRWPGRIDNAERDVLRAITGIPLTAAGTVVGVIGLAYIDEVNTFDEEKIGLLQRFAQLASLALVNARLYESAQNELDERTKAEESLRKLSHAVEQSPISIIITDTRGTIEYANPHFTRLTGYGLDELLGKTPGILKSGFTKPAEYAALWETILSGGEWRGEFQNRKKNGDLYWELALISPIRDAEGAITHFIAIKEDITDRKKLENQLRHSQKMEAIGQLAGGISHDFNNILTGIIGYASILKMKLPVESPFKGIATQILATAERGAHLTQGLLAFSRKQDTNPIRIDLNEIIGHIEKLLLRLIGEDINLKTMLDESPLTVLADSIQIEQVLMNLATNARDAMLPDGGTIVIRTGRIEIDSQFIMSNGFGEPGSFALLTFADTGSGIDDETAKRIFEPFYTTKETGKGTGLGLSIAYGILKKHNGYITCHSSPGKGSAFCLYLPLVGTPAREQRPPEPEVTYTGGSEVILLAEDDESARLLLKDLLEEFGYSVIEACDGTDALEKFHANADRIRLVILDVIMPGMKGSEVCEAIRAIRPDTRFLFCSGYTADIIHSQGVLDPDLHFIAKPYMPKELLMKIREVLEYGP